MMIKRTLALLLTCVVFADIGISAFADNQSLADTPDSPDMTESAELSESECSPPVIQLPAFSDDAAAVEPDAAEATADPVEGDDAGADASDGGPVASSPSDAGEETVSDIDNSAEMPEAASAAEEPLSCDAAAARESSGTPDAAAQIPTLTARSGITTDVDRVYFFNTGTESLESDMILVESQGHFGLVDASNRRSDVIEDSDGNTIALNAEEGLYSAASFTNGVSVAEYMISALGVTHLDFIIGTHAHSDHIGGIPEIADLTFTTTGRDICHLVDGDTVYFHKTYQPINEYNDSVWLNPVFADAAADALYARDAVIVDVSSGLSATNQKQPKNDYSAILQSIDSVSGLSGAAYDEGSLSDWYDDSLSFQMGNLQLRLYNLFSTPTNYNENTNSIVTSISRDRTNIVCLADINNDLQVEQRVSAAVAEDLGTAALVKIAHHQVTQLSNARATVDALQPKMAVATASGAQPVSGNYAAARSYAQKNYGTAFYLTGLSGRAVVATLENAGITISALAGNAGTPVYRNGNIALDGRTAVSGWCAWDSSRSSEQEDKDWLYFRNGKPVTGWKRIGSRWYWFDDNGLAAKGVTAVGSSVYLLDPFSGKGYATGWRNVDGTWYYFSSSGAAVTGWKKIYRTWYYFSSSGKMQTGWKKVSGSWYYFASSGAMITGWKKYNGSWYYFASSGEMQTGWLRSGRRWYYLKSNGLMASGETLRIGSTNYTFAASGAWIQ